MKSVCFLLNDHVFDKIMLFQSNKHYYFKYNKYTKETDFCVDIAFSQYLNFNDLPLSILLL